MSPNKTPPLPCLKLKPLRIVSAPYRRWSERRQLAREIQEAQRQIAQAADEELAHFHEELWSHWPDALEHVRQHIRKEGTFHE